MICPSSGVAAHPHLCCTIMLHVVRRVAAAQVAQGLLSMACAAVSPVIGLHSCSGIMLSPKLWWHRLPVWSVLKGTQLPDS